jgi:HPt (histidine-containing phosphotransfer) domain-containing protein
MTADKPEPPAAFDPSVYVETFGSVDDEARAIIAQFIALVRERLPGLRDLVARRDRQGVIEAAHTLAGAALTAGAMELGARCRAIERDAEVEVWDRQDGQIRSAFAAFARFKAALANL